jgi:hypothetical protein
MRSQCGVSNPAGEQKHNRKGDRLVVFIEPQDVSYPGSINKRAFYPGPDRLAGSYFQAQEH